MKKLCCLLVVFSLLFPMATTVFATDTASADTASYIESATGDTISLEAVTHTSVDTTRTSLWPDVYTTRIFRNGILEETLHVDFSRNVLQHEYPDGAIQTEVLSDVVTVTKVAPSIDDQTLETFLVVSEEGATRTTDYVGSEPFVILASGDQEPLPGATYYAGYQAMGYRGGYYYAPTTFGYLQRKNSGVEGTYHSHHFEFGAGTQIGTAASIIVAFYTSSGIGGLVLSIAVSLLGAVIDLVLYDWSTVFEIKSYKWQYRVRKSSHACGIIYTNYRTKDYWKSYNSATGDEAYEYRGTAYDSGYLLSNDEMIKFAIDSYLAG